MFGFIRSKSSELRARQYGSELKAMRQYDQAVSFIAIGEDQKALKILELNALHWKEIKFHQPAADLAEKLGRYNLAAQFYEKNGDTEKRLGSCFMGRDESYKNAVRLYRREEHEEAAERVRHKREIARDRGQTARVFSFTSLRHM